MSQAAHLVIDGCIVNAAQYYKMLRRLKKQFGGDWPEPEVVDMASIAWAHKVAPRQRIPGIDANAEYRRVVS
jgi:hypothetical protein